MAREFRAIKGSVSKLNAPYFAEKRGLWVMMVKENDRWIAINSRDEKKIRAYHEQLESQRVAANLGVKVQATSLEGNWLKAAEFSAGMLQQAKVDDPQQMMSAVESHLKAKNEAEFVPTIAQACDHFFTKQSKRQLSPHTMLDYTRLMRQLGPPKIQEHHANRFIPKPHQHSKMVPERELELTGGRCFASELRYKNGIFAASPLPALPLKIKSRWTIFNQKTI